MTPALFESQVAVMDFRETLCPNGTKCALNKQRLDIGSRPADSGGFLLPGALVVLRRKASPGAQMLRGGKHGISTPISEMIPIAAKDRITQIEAPKESSLGPIASNGTWNFFPDAAQYNIYEPNS